MSSKSLGVAVREGILVRSTENSSVLRIFHMRWYKTFISCRVFKYVQSENQEV